MSVEIKKIKPLRSITLLLVFSIGASITYKIQTGPQNIEVASYSSSYRENGQELFVGTGKARLELEEGTNLAGYRPFRGAKVSTDLESPLETRVLYLKLADDDEEVKPGLLMISVDVLGIPGPLADKMKSRLSSLGIPPAQIFLFASHTHNGPDTIGIWGGLSAQMKASILAAIVTASKNAIASQERASLWYATGETSIPAIDRRNPTQKLQPNGLSLLEFRTLERKISVIFYAAHPVALGSRSLVPSADYVGMLLKQLNTSSKSTYHFFNGALGNVNPPHLQAGEVSMNDHKILRRNAKNFSQQIAHSIYAIEKNLRQWPISSLSVTTVDFSTPVEHFPAEVFNALGLISMNVDFNNHLIAPVSRISLGSQIHFITAPGEVVKTYEQQLNQELGFSPIILSLCNEIGRAHV